MCKNKALCDKIDVEKIEEFLKENLCFECRHYASCHICNGAVCSEYEDECNRLYEKYAKGTEDE